MLRNTMGALLLALLFASAGATTQAPSGTTEAELQQTLADIQRVISESEFVFSDDDRAEWRARLSDVLRHWAAFRDARCDARLLTFEKGIGNDAARAEAAACRQAFDRTIAADLRSRYALAGGGRGRPSLDPAIDARPFYPEEPDALDCDPPPPAECDYCGVNVCWERELARDDEALNGLWHEVLASIRGRASLTAAARADWVERLRRSQRAWLLLRDDNCALESWETPNRFAHSIYATQLAPCLHAETRARMERLRARYLGVPNEAAVAGAPERLTIPAEFRGRWAETAELCGEPDGPVEVHVDGIDYAASAVRPVMPTPTADGFAFSSRTMEEGERIDEQIQLRRDGARLMIVRDGESQSYIACPPG